MKGSRLTIQQISIFTVMIYLGLSFIKPLAGIFSLYIYVNISFIRSLCGGFLLYILTYLFHSISGCGYITIYLHISCSEPLGGGFSYIYTDISPSVRHLVRVSHYRLYTEISPSVSHWVGVSHYRLYTDISPSVRHWVRVSHYRLYTEISPSVSHWVGVSHYIHWHFTFSEPLDGGFSLYTLTFHLQWATWWGFLTIYTDISPSVSHWVGVSHYIHWHFTFSESLGGGFSLYTLTFHIQWVTGWGFHTIYTDISPSVSHWVGVSHYIHWHFTFSEPLGGGFSLYTLTFDIQWATGWGFLAIYTDISHSVSHWVGVSHYRLYSDISPLVSIWVRVSRHIYCYFIFSESLGGGFSLYIHWHFTFSEPLGGGFSLYTLTKQAQLNIVHKINIKQAQLNIVHKINIKQAQLNTVHKISTKQAQLNIVHKIDIRQTQLCTQDQYKTQLWNRWNLTLYIRSI